MPTVFIQQLAAVWLTLNLTIGYGVAPVLFSQLDSEVAGEIMAVLLSATYWLDIIILLLMLWISRQAAKWVKRDRWLWGALTAIVINLAWISPLMAQLKQLPEMDAIILGLNFAAWHGVLQLVFLCAWLSVLIWSLLTSRAASKAVMNNS